jgi:hypothetical protein
MIPEEVGMTRIPTYFHDGRQIQFWPEKRVPGFTHRVVIDRVAVDWLAQEYKPNGTAARFFLEKHSEPRR